MPTFIYWFTLIVCFDRIVTKLSIYPSPSFTHSSIAPFITTLVYFEEHVLMLWAGKGWFIIIVIAMPTCECPYAWIYEKQLGLSAYGQTDSKEREKKWKFQLVMIYNKNWRDKRRGKLNWFHACYIDFSSRILYIWATEHYNWWRPVEEDEEEQDLALLFPNKYCMKV